VRLAVLISVAILSHAVTLADDSQYVINFDLNTLSPDGDIVYSIQLQGIHLSPETPFHGNDLGKYDYFLTVSEIESGETKLTIEFYEYESRRKTSEVVSEIVAEVDVRLGMPTEFESMSDTFGVDLAFSINQE